jgi:hypothetical protein
MSTTTETVTTSAVFEIDGWVCTPAMGPDVAPEVAANETLLRKALIEFFQDTFIVTGEPEVRDITVEGVDYDFWVEDDDEDEEDEEQ